MTERRAEIEGMTFRERRRKRKLDRNSSEVDQPGALTRNAPAPTGMTEPGFVETESQGMTQRDGEVFEGMTRHAEEIVLEVLDFTGVQET